MNAKHLEIVSHFAIRGTVTDIKPLGEGLINDTLLVKTAEDEAPDYVMQRVNRNVFPDVEMVMRNIHAVTTHIRRKLEAANETDIDRCLPSSPQRKTTNSSMPSSTENTGA